MSFELALRLTEVLLALAFIQQSAEHLSGAKDECALFLPRLVLSGLLLIGFYTPIICSLLTVHALLTLCRFQGPYNGGSDRMGLLILFCATLAHVLPYVHWQEMALGYLALQLLLSYFISGYVKIINPEWLSGQALQDVFSFSAYPASEALRGLTNKPRMLRAISWVVIGFELAFPLSFLTEATLLAALLMAALFHLANAFLFGLNRFFWVWLAAYPSILWLQDRIMSF